MKHVMIDLETLGTSSDSVFLSVAAVQFNDTDVGEVFYRTVSMESALKAGRKINPQTLEWWLDQKPEVMKLMFSNPVSLDDLLIDFKKFILSNESVCLWGNSASFDVGKLTHAYENSIYPKPWSHRNEKCYRTIKSIFHLPPSLEPELVGEAHNPVDDCVYQIKKLQAICRFYNFALE